MNTGDSDAEAPFARSSQKGVSFRCLYCYTVASFPFPLSVFRMYSVSLMLQSIALTIL